MVFGHWSVYVPNLTLIRLIQAACLLQGIVPVLNKLDDCCLGYSYNRLWMSSPFGAMRFLAFPVHAHIASL